MIGSSSRWIASHPDLTAASRVMLYVLWSYVNAADEEPVVWPTVETLANDTRLSVRGAYKLLADLQAAGLLARRNNVQIVRRGRTTVIPHAIVLSHPAPSCTQAVHAGAVDPAPSCSRPCTVVQSLPYGSDQLNDPTERQSAAEEPPLTLVSSPPEARRPRAPRKPRVSVPDGLADHVLAEMQSAWRDVIGRAGGPRRITPGMLDALSLLHAAEEPTPEEWTRAIRHRAALDVAKAGYGELTWEHMCRPASFRRYRDAPPPQRRRLAAFSVSHDDDE